MYPTEQTSATAMYQIKHIVATTSVIVGISCLDETGVSAAGPSGGMNYHNVPCRRCQASREERSEVAFSLPMVT